MKKIVEGHRATLYETYTKREVFQGLALMVLISVVYLAFVYGALASL